MLDRPMASTQTLRLVELHTSDVFCTPLEARFDRLTRLAQASLQTPIVAITARAGQRLWFKSVIGWNVRELALSDSLSARTLAATELVVVEDTYSDPATASHPLVTTAPGFRFYAGHSLADQRGAIVGSFDFYDLKPRQLSARDRQTIQDLVHLARKELLTTDLRDAQTQLVQKLDLARREALMDSLTATWNRRAADELLQHALAAADNDGGAVAVCLIDIDNFKQINDTLGHAAGDTALRRVARHLVSGVRDGDAVCRVGGDEFLIIMERVGPNDAEDIATRIRVSLSQLPLRLANRTLHMAVSAGTSLRRTGVRTAAADLVKHADRALYHAKQSRSTSTRRGSECR